MSPVAYRIWLLLGGVSAVDLFWCAAERLTVSNWQPFLLVAATLLALALVARRAGLPRLGLLAEWTLIWLIFSVAAAILTYAAATRDGPLFDARLAAFDRALGFDWNAWIVRVRAHPLAEAMLRGAYESLLAQILLTIAWFTWQGREERIAELIAAVTIALLLTTAVFCLFPAFGPGVDVPGFELAYLGDLTGLRNGTLPSLDVMLLKGVITFPSFHAVLAVLFVWAHRDSISLVPAAALNLVMLVAIPSEGGHYLVDIFGGFAVVAVAIPAARFLPAPRPALAPATTA
jgi:hypothetical protein